MKKKYFVRCPVLELFHCLPLWKTVLLSSSRAFLLSAPTFLFSTPMDNSEATRKKSYTMQQTNLSLLRQECLIRHLNGNKSMLSSIIKFVEF